MCLTGFCHCQGYPPTPVLTRTSYWIRDWENVCKYIMIHIMFIKLIFIIHLVVLQAKEFNMYFFVDVDVDVAEMRRWGFVEPVQLCNTLVYSVDVGDDVLLTLILTLHVCNLILPMHFSLLAYLWQVAHTSHSAWPRIILPLVLESSYLFYTFPKTAIYAQRYQIWTNISMGGTLRAKYVRKLFSQHCGFFWTTNDKKTYQKVQELSGKAPSTILNERGMEPVCVRGETNIDRKWMRFCSWCIFRWKPVSLAR